MDLLRMTPALTLNGEANFEWQPAAKATTQLITHVTSKYRRKKCCQAPAKSARLPCTMAVFWDFLSKKYLRLVDDRNHYFGLGPIPKPKL